MPAGQIGFLGSNATVKRRGNNEAGLTNVQVAAIREDFAAMLPRGNPSVILKNSKPD